MLFYIIMALVAFAGILSALASGDVNFFIVSYVSAIVFSIMLLIAWIKKIFLKRRSEKVNIEFLDVKSKDIEVFVDDFHNDFSKVPAGEPDDSPLMPRTIAFGTKDSGRAFEEDLAKLGEKINNDRSSDKENK